MLEEEEERGNKLNRQLYTDESGRQRGKKVCNVELRKKEEEEKERRSILTVGKSGRDSVGLSTGEKEVLLGPQPEHGCSDLVSTIFDDAILLLSRHDMGVIAESGLVRCSARCSGLCSVNGRCIACR